MSYKEHNDWLIEQVKEKNKRIEELNLDIKYLENKNKELNLALGKSDAQLIKIKQIIMS